MAIDVRKGMPDTKLSRKEFERRFKERFRDPAFDTRQDELNAIAAIAWDAYDEGRKAPVTRKAGIGFADPSYDLSIDWLDASDAIAAAQRRHDDQGGVARFLIVNGSSRSEHTCPGEMSKTWRLVEMARAALLDGGQAEAEILDLSRTTSEFGRTIHPCKSCVSTAMPLCHWPCSCYPNYALGQVNDWMNEIYPMWVAANGILIIAPVNWYQTPGPLKAMMDRLVCADGGNPDPTSTHGKHAEEAKKLELDGWPFPKHLAGRLFSAVVHGDTTGAESVRRALMDWAADMHLVSAGARSEVDAYIGYYEPYATSHQALDRDSGFQEEVRNAAITLRDAVFARRDGKMVEAGSALRDPRPK